MSMICTERDDPQKLCNHAVGQYPKAISVCNAGDKLCLRKKIIQDISQDMLIKVLMNCPA